MNEYVVWYTAVSRYPVLVRATSEKDAKAIADRVIADAEDGRDTPAVNHMYDQHDPCGEFNYEQTVAV
jgi:hypothetical protein